MLRLTLLLLLFYLIAVQCQLRPACLLTEKDFDLSSYPIGSRPVSWINTFASSSSSPSVDQIRIMVEPDCGPRSSFNSEEFNRNLNSSNFGKNLLLAEKVSSTMELARDYIGIPGLVVIADEQVKGRGRGGQQWKSPYGDIYMTVNVNLTDNSVAPLLQGIAALSVVNAVHEKRSGYQGLDLSYVWPNSIAWSDGKVKIGGVIVEQSQIDDSWFSIGLGVRLNSVSGLATLKAAISAHNTMFGTDLGDLNREEMIARILSNLDSFLDLLNRDSQIVRDLLAAKWTHIKRTVNLNFKGIVTGISPIGELIVKDPHGIQALVHPDLHTLAPDDTIIPLPVYPQNSNGIYESDF